MLINTLDDCRKVTSEYNWKLVANSLLTIINLPSKTSELFAIYWIEGGHHIRQQVADDQLLSLLLHRLLPQYTGDDLVLYRGESIERWDSGKTGFAWTTDIDIARMFARGLNSTPTGGVLLEGQFGAEAIISGPNSHSQYLGEMQFTIDPFHKDRNIKAIEKFPAIP